MFNICSGLKLSATSNSISLSSNSLFRSFFLNISLVESLASLPASALITRSSAASSACAFFSSRIFFRTIMMALSTRSRTICSTSRPTYPTSVNLVASTLIKGAFANLARRLDISVLPTPVGPIINIFFGYTSSFNSSESCFLRHLFLSATATALLASFWPIMNLSSSETISRGVKSVILNTFYSHSSIRINTNVCCNCNGFSCNLLSGLV